MATRGVASKGPSPLSSQPFKKAPSTRLTCYNSLYIIIHYSTYFKAIFFDAVLTCDVICVMMLFIMGIVCKHTCILIINRIVITVSPTACIPTHPTQVRQILMLYSAHWLLTLSMVANPRKAPTRLYTTYEKIQLETVTHPGINAPNVA